jgi:ACR3 family arsenite efflux pump ArsB
MIGVILIELARCITPWWSFGTILPMEIEYAAGLIIANSILQVLLYSVYAYVFITTYFHPIWLPGFLKSTSASGQIASVGIYLGRIPFALESSADTLLSISRWLVSKVSMYRLFHQSP